MLEEPNLPEQIILTFLQADYGLPVRQVKFLPLGADVNTAVYRIITEDETAYFLKLRGGAFDEITVLLPHFLQTHGMPAVMSPLENRNGRLWGSLGHFKTILYPYIPGQNGYEVRLSDQQWVDFGATLNRIHSIRIPSEISKPIPSETFTSRWRDKVRDFQSMVERTTFEDPVAVKFARAMKTRKKEIRHMVDRADQLARDLVSQNQDFVLCHSDIHPGNLLIPERKTNGSAEFYIVDWDNPTMAPKEHDLGLIGGCATWHDAHKTALFYQGYGKAQVNSQALVYYRYERIIQDIAVEGEQVLLNDQGGQNREQEYQYFLTNFYPGHEVEIAVETDRSLQASR